MAAIEPAKREELLTEWQAREAAVELPIDQHEGDAIVWAAMEANWLLAQGAQNVT